MRFASLALVLLLALPASGQTVYTWGGGSGDWFSESNWSPSGIPGAGDTALITSGSPEVSRDTTVATVEFGGASLDGDGTLTVTASMEWSDGQMNGRTFADTAALAIASGATLRITGDGEKGLRGRDLLNDGTVVWEGAGDLVVQWPTTIENRTGATFDIQTDADLTRTNGTLDLINDGLLVKSAGTDETRFVFLLGSLANNGTIRAEAGVLDLANANASAQSSSGDGAFEATEGAELQFSAGYGFGTGSTLSGAGTVRFVEGTTEIGRATMTGPTRLDGGTLSLTSADTASELADVLLAADALGGPGNIEIDGLLTWTGGALGTGVGAAPTLTLRGGTEISGEAAKQFRGGTTVNASTMRWLEGPLEVASSAAFRNLAGATLSIESDTTWTRRDGFIPITNEGTIVKTGSDGRTTISLRFAPITNDGEVRVESGTLSLATDGSSSTSTDTGRYVVAEGAALRFGGTQRTFTADASLEGAGTLAFDGPVVFGGTVRPGTSPGILTIAGDGLPPEAGAVLDVEVGGTTPGTEHDQLVVTGTAALGGTLRMTLLDGFEPSGGDRVTLLRAASVTGAFDAIELPDGLPGEVEVTDTTVVYVRTVGVASDAGPEALPEALALSPPSPNPTSGPVTLAVALPEAGPVRVAVYDALGREVAVMVDREMPAGEHTIRLGAGLAPGVYVVRLGAGAEAASRMLTVVR
ncbi:MAG: T9SS type A sorting domain-containing protein [Bacteroidota bacterium]